MLRRLLAGLCGLASVSVCQACMASRPPQAVETTSVSDVGRYIARRDACDLYSGEDPYDPERAVFLDRKMLQTCPANDARRDTLCRKYRHDPELIARLECFGTSRRTGG